MRKRLKNKKRSCCICKPHKTGHAIKLKPKDLDKLERAEKEIQSLSRE